MAFPLSRIESFPSHTRTRILQCGEPASTSISRFIRVLLNCFLFKLLPFVGGWGGGRGGHRSLPHLFLSTASAIIDILADVASLLFTGGRNTGHRLPHVFWQQNRPLNQTQPPETNWTVDISLVSGGSTGHSHQYVMEEAWAEGINMASGCSLCHGPRQSPRQQLGPGHHHGFR